ncbi:uncharacterized protein LOC131956939 [Physella acuta]|uniref:uncharacterized protein LOC131956939 n=1 Tax=Physella acuta TaxID=109671 RepID=UPI0027DD561E|nr:uncharacterized protein LOC131956939 [Physella acuta]
MSHFYSKFVFSINATTKIATIPSASSTTTTITATPIAVVAGVLSDSMRREAMDVVVAKIICLLILTILSVLSGLLPLRLLIHTPHLFTRGRNSVDYFLCGLRLFSGGIYLATCFLHLMPDTRIKMDAVMKNMGSMTTYAVPELLVMSGFYAVVFVEQIIQALYVKAQQSDIYRKQKKAQKKSKPEPEPKKPVPVFRSTLDDDVSQDNNNIDHTEHKRYNDDDDDDDDDDNVLIEDEEDLSFEETDSDRNSLDSVTQLKENLLEKDDVFEKPDTQHRSQHNSTGVDQHNGINNTSYHPQHTIHHSKPQNEADNQVLKTFGQTHIHTVPKIVMGNSRPYQNSGPPMIHARIQQQSPQQTVRHQLQNHVTIQEEKKQTRYDATTPRSTSPPLPPHPQYYTQQDRQQHPHPHTTSQPSSTPAGETTQLWPPISSLHQHDDIDDNNEKNKPNHSYRGHLARDQTKNNDVDRNKMSDTDRTSETDRQKLPDVERGRSYDAETASLRRLSEDDKDSEAGVGTPARNGDTVDAELQRPIHSTSRDASFDRISDSSSVMQDIQVKRVVDELSRTDDVDELSRTDDSRAHFRSIIYIMALSFHGIFEGMALGLQSMKSSVWSLCFAIVVHRCVLAFKLGMDLCRGEEKQGTALLCIGMFTLISTLGIIIGILISSGASLYSDVSVPEAILQSLATGTIFYIVFFDILFKDLEGKDDLKRVSSSFVGFSLMAIVFAITRS